MMPAPADFKLRAMLALAARLSGRAAESARRNQGRGIDMHRVKRFAAGLAVAAACAAAQGKPLPDVDALASAGAAKRRAVDAAQMQRLGVQGHADERLGVPNFLRVQPGSPARAKALASPRQQLRVLAPLYGVAAAFCVYLFFLLLIVTLITNKFAAATKSYAD